MKNQLFITLLIAGLVLSSCNNIDPEKIQIVSHQTGMTGTMRGIDVVDEQTVWISGSRGEFCTTSDGGENWIFGQVPGADSLDFRDVHGFSDQIALLMSAGPGDASKIFKTMDGGKIWKLCYTNTEPKGFFDGMDFLDEQHGVLFSDPVDDRLNMLVTNDGGENWTRFHPELVPEIAKGEYAFAASGTSIQYDPSGGIWIATGGSVARIWFTPELGKEWTIWDSPALQGDGAEGLFSIAPRSTIRVVAVGGNYQNIKKTGLNVVKQNRVGEVNWEVPDGADKVPFMESIKWVNNSSLIACGPPGVWLSTDFGESWIEISQEGFHTMDISENGKTGWLAGNKGVVSQILW
ncbi:MAG: hypothetical protein KAH17_03100 [Bacteroidales bacterium]|nr:hypothetical protein [Bacteroidales bacterium]